MVDRKAAKDCGFDVLFGKSVPHIIDKIFLKLDFDSFMPFHGMSRGEHSLEYTTLIWSISQQADGIASREVEQGEEEKERVF